MLFFGIAALMEFLMNPDVLGPSVNAFKVYYILRARLWRSSGLMLLY